MAAIIIQAVVELLKFFFTQMANRKAIREDGVVKLTRRDVMPDLYATLRQSKTEAS